MAFNEKMADRVRELLAPCGKPVVEKKMFSGLCFMVNDKMCVAVRPDSIMVRVNPEQTESLADQPGCALMSHSGKTMKGFIFVDNDLLHTKKQLSAWVDLALAYNDEAKSSKKRKTAKK